MSAPLPSRLSIAQKVALAGEVVRTYVQAKRTLDRTDLPATLTALRAPAASVEATMPYDDAVRLGRIVGRTLAVLPADARCLMRSLVLVGLLARRGTSGDLVIAVKPGESFGAHAWVEVDGRPLLPTGEDEFSRLVAL